MTMIMAAVLAANLAQRLRDILLYFFTAPKTGLVTTISLLTEFVCVDGPRLKFVTNQA